jgi:hypothetical protein
VTKQLNSTQSANDATHSRQVLVCEALLPPDEGDTSRMLVLVLADVKPPLQLLGDPGKISDLLHVSTASKINDILGF